MKSCRYQPRSYRSWILPAHLRVSRLSMRETDLLISTDIKLDRSFARERLRLLRAQIEDYGTRQDRAFFASLKPVPVDPFAPAVILQMARTAKAANVGPMAAVAGAIADDLGAGLLARGCKEVIIENGGDAFLKVRRPVRVGLFAGNSPFSGAIAFEVSPRQTPCGIATSSGTVGHSLSFGCADSVTVFADCAALADACATAAGNMITSAADFGKAIDFVRSVPGARACVCVLGNQCGAWGNVKLVSSRKAEKNFTKKQFQRREKILDKAGRYDKKIR